MSEEACEILINTGSGSQMGKVAASCHRVLGPDIVSKKYKFQGLGLKAGGEAILRMLVCAQMGGGLGTPCTPL